MYACNTQSWYANEMAYTNNNNNSERDNNEKNAVAATLVDNDWSFAAFHWKTADELNKFRTEKFIFNGNSTFASTIDSLPTLSDSSRKYEFI